MAGGSWIRIGAVDAHLDARTINSIIETTLVKRAKSITQNPTLRKQIGEELLVQVTPFIPYDTGQLSESGRATPDGRLYWSAIGEEGENYAYEMYDRDKARWPNGYNRPTLGKYPGPNHAPQPRWMERVQPGTPEWEAFVNRITPIIKEAFENE